VKRKQFPLQLDQLNKQTIFLRHLWQVLGHLIDIELTNVGFDIEFCNRSQGSFSNNR